MKRVIGMVAGLVFAGSVAAAEQPRLALWITEPIGTSSGSKCNLNLSAADAAKLPVTSPTLTERDVIAWNPSTARWKLDPARFTDNEHAQQLKDHCFILAIDGKPAASGMALAEYSARLSGFPTMIILSRNNALELELLSNNHGGMMRHLHADALGNILRQKNTKEK